MATEEGPRHDPPGETEALNRQLAELKISDDRRREAEAEYRAVFEQLSDAVFIADTETGAIVDCNRQAEALLGRSRDEIVGLNQAQLHPAGQGELYSQLFREYVAGKSGFLCGDVETADGRVVPVSISASVVALGGKKRILGVFRDMTEQKRAEEALSESDARFRNVVGSAPMGIHMYRLEPGDRLVFTGANPAADAILGVDNDQFIGRTIEEAFPPLVHSDVPEAYRRVAAKGVPWDTEQIDYQDDTIRGAYEVHAFQTMPGNMAAMFLDITERKRAEEALRASEERFRSLVQNASSVVLLLSPDHRIIEFNPEAERVYGSKRADMLGRDYLETCVPEDARDAVAADIRKVLSGVPTLGFENKIATHAGERRFFSWDVGRILDADGQPAGIVAVGSDITERKRAEEQLQTIVDRSPIPTAVGGGDGSVISMNEAMEELTGYERSEIRDVTDWMEKLYPDPEYQAFVSKNIQQALSGEQQDCTEFTITRKDRQKRVARFETAFFEGGLIIQVIDITERKRAEEELRKSDEELRLFRGLLDRSVDAVIVASGESGQIVDANEAACRMLGRERGDLLGLSYNDIDKNMAQPEFAARFHDSLEKTGSVLFESTAVRPDGSETPVEVSVKATTLGDRQYTVAIGRDICKRR